MGFRAVGTNDGSYVGIGGQNPISMKPEDPTKKYVNIYSDGAANGGTVVASVEVKYLMDSLLVEGFIESYTLPKVVEPLSQTERVAKAIMEAGDLSKYSDEEFRTQVDYEDYMLSAKHVLAGDN